MLCYIEVTNNLLCCHLQPLPDKMDDQLTALQRALVIRAVRSDRLMQLGVGFVNATLGKKYVKLTCKTCIVFMPKITALLVIFNRFSFFV